MLGTRRISRRSSTTSPSCTRKWGNYVEARTLFERALAIDRRDLDGDAPNVAALLPNLASLHLDLGEYADAERLATEALAIYRRVPDGASNDIAAVLDTLGVLRKRQGDYAGAERHYQDALAAFGPERNSVVRANLADLYEVIGDFARSEKLYSDVLREREEQYGPDQPAVARTLNNLGELYRSTGRLDEAARFHQRALAIRRRLGEHHPDIATSLNNLAFVDLDAGKYTMRSTCWARC